jgi:hypothetical protein
MGRITQSTASRRSSQSEGRNADLFLADLNGSTSQGEADAEALSRPNRGLSFDDLFGGAPPRSSFPVSEAEEAPARAPARLAAITAKMQTLDRHLGRGKLRTGVRESWGEDFAPTSVPGVGGEFDIFLSSLFDLEKAAIKDGYTFTQRVSAIRKIFYDSPGWDVIIPGAAPVKPPSSWSSAALASALKDVRDRETIDIQGKRTAFGHLLTGLDAGNHPVKPLQLKFLSNPIVSISSGKAQATYAGDLGSVCYEYQKARGKGVPMGKAVKNLDSTVMKKAFNDFASDADMGGNADAYALTLNSSVTVTQNLFDYYTALPGAGIHQRWYHLIRSIIAGRTGSAVWSELTWDVFSSSEAYAVGAKNDKLYIFNIQQKPRPGIFVPTFWEFAMNSAAWTLDVFFDRVIAELDALQKSLTKTP